MSSRKILIDTNVLLGLEDEREVEPRLAEMLRACAQHGVRVFVHEASIQDIRRDRDTARQRVTLSKLAKFEQLQGVHEAAPSDLEARFGPSARPNDRVDVALLHALDVGAVDFLVTEDRGVHTRARRRSTALADRTFTVADALGWLRSTYEPRAVVLPLVQEVKAHAIALDDDIFDSLRDGYPDFDRWWREKCVAEHRACWAVTIGQRLAGLVVRKDETHAEAGTRHPGPKILKICTFKVKPAFQGEKLGELLLKQTLWFAQRNAYDLVYVTTFASQAVLLRVLAAFGFEQTGSNARGELIYEKPISRARLDARPGDDLLALARTNYPRFVCGGLASAFCVPIRGEYHDLLFPELARRRYPDLFDADGPLGALAGPRTPGNTIRKVYLCRAPTRQLRPGSVLVFYQSQSADRAYSQCMTSVGIVESVNEANGLDDLVRLTAKRSVYSTDQLRDMASQSSAPVKVIDFLLVGHLDPPIALAELLRDGVFASSPPQSICAIPPDRLSAVRRRMKFGFEV